MNLGPIEFLVLAFPTQEFGPDVVATLRRVQESGDIQVIDSLVIIKSPIGEITCSEVAEIDALRGEEWLPDLATLIDEADADEIAQAMDPGHVAIALLLEHVWAREATQALRAAGGHVLASVRIPPERVEEAQAVQRKEEG